MNTGSLRIIFLSSLALLTKGVWAEGENLVKERTLSFSSGYLTGSSSLGWSNSNRALSNFYDEMTMAYGEGFDALAETGWAKHNRGWFATLNFLLNTYISVGVLWVSYHEFGHFTRAKAFGKDPYFEDERNSSVRGISNPFSYTISRFTHPIYGATYPGKDLWPPASGVPQAMDWEIIFSAGGVNNSMRFSADV